MQNMSTADFCTKFNACDPGVEFSKAYPDMHSCYEALLDGMPDLRSASSWAGWIYDRPGIVVSEDHVRMALSLVALIRADRLAEPAVTYLDNARRGVDASLRVRINFTERYLYNAAYDGLQTDASYWEWRCVKSIQDAIAGKIWLTVLSTRAILEQGKRSSAGDRLSAAQLQLFRDYGNLFKG